MLPYRVGNVFMPIKFKKLLRHPLICGAVFAGEGERERGVCCWPQSLGGHVSGEGPGDEICQSTHGKAHREPAMRARRSLRRTFFRPERSVTL